MQAEAPRCPLTGAPVERVAQVSAKLIYDLWRWGAGVRPTPLRRDAGAIGLWHAPCGLLFWHPAPAGDAAFYARLYRRFRARERRPELRTDMRAAAALIAPGWRVLDVGCGEGAFAAVVPQARWTGLEPHGPARPGILARTLPEHAAEHPGAYDAVVAFQVLEHAADPLALARAAHACLRPGGLLVASMPRWPSPLTGFANNLVNLPPHHLSLWTETAATTLAERAGFEMLRVSVPPPSPSHATALWLARLLPRVAGPPVPVHAGWGGHARLAAAFAAARLLAVTRRLPRDAAPIDVLLVARRRGPA